jgi:hypothetical protein
LSKTCSIEANTRSDAIFNASDVQSEDFYIKAIGDCDLILETLQYRQITDSLNARSLVIMDNFNRSQDCIVPLTFNHQTTIITSPTPTINQSILSKAFNQPRVLI